MDDQNTPTATGDIYVTMTANIVAAFVGSSANRVDPNAIPDMIGTIHSALSNLGQTAAPAAVEQEFTPATTVRKSLASPDVIISLIDGKPYKTLRRHLSGHGLTPVQYRERYGLKADYPMVSETYSQARRDMAKKIGLGRKPRAATETKAAAPAKAKTTRAPRKAKTEAAAA